LKCFNCHNNDLSYVSYYAGVVNSFSTQAFGSYTEINKTTEKST